MSPLLTREFPSSEPSADSQREKAGAALLNAVSGPCGAKPVLQHPALHAVLCPIPLTKEGLEIKALIDKQVERLATCSPQLIIPGVSFCNQPGDGEKPVINLPEFSEKRTLLWSEVGQFRAADAQELAEVSRQIETTLGVPCDTEGALAVLVARMKTLLLHSTIAALATERAYQIEDKVARRQVSLMRKLLPVIPSIKAQDEALKAEMLTATQEAECHARLHGARYLACPRRAAMSLMLKRLDSLWYYRPAASQEDAGLVVGVEEAILSAQRINTISIALASIGIFQKGFGCWDQQYPSSPLQFWKDHIEPYLVLKQRDAE